MKGIRIGELLVEQGLLSASQVNTILALQRRSHRPFGDLAERLYGLSPNAIEDAWVEQYVRLAGVVDLDEQEIEIDCLRRINRRQAWQFHLLPLNQEGSEIQMATNSDNLVRALNFATRSVEDPVYMVIAEREQLQEFLMKHYPVPRHIAQYAETM
ncbi:MAG: hypothetical protein IT447_15560 [Phycisphaerales bacterium]|nr:hypothetical protein [Phycisphaerales bacterium]